MATLHLLFNHQLSDEQRKDAIKSLGIKDFIALPEDLQQRWSNIPPELESLDDYLKPITEYLDKNLKAGDIVLVQGDFGASYNMVNHLKKYSYKIVYATTQRNIIEVQNGDKTIKKSIFRHQHFRQY